MITRNPLGRLLSMVLCICMVLSLLPGISLAANAAEAETMKIYFRNDWKWSDIKIYFWGSKTADNPGWPGKSMTYYGSSNNLDYYVYEVPTDVIGIIINGIRDDGSGNRDQSPDIKSGWYDGITYYMYWNNGNAVKSFNIRDVFACKHTTTETVAGYAATCTKDGLTDGQKCTECGEMVTAQTVIPAAHKFVDEVCSVCGADQYMKVYFRNDWNWSDISLYYWYDGGVDNKWPGDAMSFYDNDGSHDYYVSKVPTDIKGLIVNGIKDDGSGALDQSPNVESGWYDGVTYYMHWDGGNKVSSFNIADVKFPCKHVNQEPIPGKDATCVDPGLTEGIKCSDCGEIILEQWGTPVLGHDWIEATCTDPITCGICGATEGNALGHSYSAECDSDCDRCGKIREPGDHTYQFACDTYCWMCGQLTNPEAEHMSDQPSCKDGVCVYGCGTVIAATSEHHYECFYEQAPTCELNGVYYYQCTNCGDVYEEYPPATGEHSYDNDCDAYCNSCGQYREVPGHRFENGVCSCGKVQEFTVSWVVDRVVFEETYEYGQMPVFTGSTDKNQNGCIVYTFDGWDQEIVPVTEQAIYYATYIETTKHTVGETVTFVLNEGNCSMQGEIQITVYCASCNGEISNDIVSTGFGDHSWEDADCTMAEWCGICGETRGEPLGHSYTAADYEWAEDYTYCTATGVCGTCGETCYDYGYSSVTELSAATCVTPAYLEFTAAFAAEWAETQTVQHHDPAERLDPDNHTFVDGFCACGTVACDILGHKDVDNSGRCDICQALMQDAKICFATASLEGNIAINFYTLLSDAVIADPNAYMQFIMADGKVIQLSVSEAVFGDVEGETYYVFTRSVNAKEMADDVICQIFYEGGFSNEVSYDVKAYGNYIINEHDDASAKALAEAMLNYGAASQLHFGYNADDLANAGLAAPDYSNVTISGFNATAGQGTELATLYSASLILKSETTLRFFFKVDSAVENFTVTYKGQTLEVKQRSGLYYVDVVGIAAKDLDKDVTITINDGITTADVSFNPMSYCQGVQNDNSGAFSNEMKDLVTALYLYNQAANEYFKEDR